eukprot:3196614-Alexandrium_andersonii.AAC.1
MSGAPPRMAGRTWGPAATWGGLEASEGLSVPWPSDRTSSCDRIPTFLAIASRAVRLKTLIAAF